MKSSSGQYFVALDHVRAAAAFTVFTWHFNHIHDGHLAPPPVFPLSYLTEGHIGVALFMTLSGYLFAKLLDGKTILFGAFLWNRCLRLLPLLCLVVLLVGAKIALSGASLAGFARSVVAGVIQPTLPNGGWSITVEFHFYVILPLLLYLTRRWKYSLVGVLLCAIAIRALIYQETGQVQSLAYWTIVGCIDQFLLGILAFQFRARIVGHHALVLVSALVFLAYYRYFDEIGGFYGNGGYPSPSVLWLIHPTIAGSIFALCIAWYDNSFEHGVGPVSTFIARIGTYSYSIYLLHFFFVFEMARLVDASIVRLTNVALVLVFSALCFFMMLPLGYISYRFVELPFLRFRRPYILNTDLPGELAQDLRRAG